MLAATARSEKQRRESLASLTEHLVKDPFANPSGTHSILIKLLPLVTDTYTPVRKQLIRLLKCLPPSEVKGDAERVTIFVRAGLTHLSTDIGNDALEVMEWLLDTAPAEAVSCPGGWVKTLSGFCAILGWSATNNQGWSSAPTKPTLKAKDSASRAQQLAVRCAYLTAPRAKLVSDRRSAEMSTSPPSLWQQQVVCF